MHPIDLDELANNLDIISAEATFDARTRVGLALNSVVQFLSKQPKFSKDSVAPLWTLLTAFGDLEAGTSSSLFAPKKLSGRPPMSTQEQLVMALAATAVDAMIAYCSLTLTEALQTVNTAVGKAGYQGLTTNKIKGWRDRLSEGPGRVPPFALKAWDLYMMECKQASSMDVEGWLAHIQDGVRRIVLNNPRS